MTPKTKFIAFTSKDIPESDTGIKLKEMISLLKGNEFETHFLESLDVENSKEEFVSIPGAKTAISKLHEVDKIYEKIDHETSYRRLEFDPSRKSKEEFAIMFEGVKNEVAKIAALPIYSARTDFFDKMNGMDKYASQLFSKNLASIVYANLELLQGDKKAREISTIKGH